MDEGDTRPCISKGCPSKWYTHYRNFFHSVGKQLLHKSLHLQRRMLGPPVIHGFLLSQHDCVSVPLNSHHNLAFKSQHISSASGWPFTSNPNLMSIACVSNVHNEEWKILEKYFCCFHKVG